MSSGGGPSTLVCRPASPAPSSHLRDYVVPAAADGAPHPSERIAMRNPTAAQMMAKLDVRVMIPGLKAWPLDKPAVRRPLNQPPGGEHGPPKHRGDQRHNQ